MNNHDASDKERGTRYTPLRIAKPAVSALLDRRAALAGAVLIAMIAIAAIISAGIGTMRINPIDVLKVFAGQGQDIHTTVILQFRLPRIALSLLVGASLAAAGAIIQGMIRNPLASPDLIGVTNGAAAAAVSFIALTAGTFSIRWLPLVAILGAAIASFLIYTFAWKRGVTPMRLVLIGIGMSTALSAFTSVMLIASPLRLASQALAWITGSVYGAAWSGVLTLLPWTAIGLPLAFALARQVNAQQLGDDLAVGLGSRVQRQRLALLALSVALAGSAVAIAGGIAFIGLMAPHLARRLVGPAFGSVLPVAALIGGLLVMVADLAARTLFMPTEIPAGVFTAAIGAPFFIYLLRKRSATS